MTNKPARRGLGRGLGSLIPTAPEPISTEQPGPADPAQGSVQASAPASTLASTAAPAADTSTGNTRNTVRDAAAAPAPAADGESTRPHPSHRQVS